MARKDIQSHCQAVQIQKSSQLLDLAHITTFLRKTEKEMVPALLTLEKDPSTENLEWFYGLLGDFIVCTTGHGKGVLSNLKVEEVTSAPSDSSQRQIIGVRDHKTRKCFGHALIPLTRPEYMWLERFIYHGHSYSCSDSELFFSNRNSGPFQDILKALQKCWVEFGLPGMPTFALIRSSISTCLRWSLDHAKCDNVRRMMCHLNATTKKFYEANFDFSKAFQTRQDTAYF